MSTQLDTLRRYVSSHPPTFMSEGPEGVLLVGSGKGGVGTSTIAGLIAVMAAADGNQVLVVDADESHGALPLLFGVEHTLPLRKLRGDASPADMLVPLGHGLTLLPAGGDDDQVALEATERRMLLRQVTSLFDRFDLVVVDTGSRLQQVLSTASVMGTRMLAVTAPERISAAATYALTKVIDSSFEDLPVDIVFNHAGLSTASDAFAEVDAATRHFLQRSLGFAGAVPTDERLRDAIESGCPVQDAAVLGTPATAACHELAARLTSKIVNRTQHGHAVLRSSNHQRSSYRA